MSLRRGCQSVCSVRRGNLGAAQCRCRTTAMFKRGKGRNSLGLIDAAQNGDLARVKAKLKAGCDVNSRDEVRAGASFRAARGHLASRRDGAAAGGGAHAPLEGCRLGSLPRQWLGRLLCSALPVCLPACLRATARDAVPLTRTWSPPPPTVAAVPYPVGGVPRPRGSCGSTHRRRRRPLRHRQGACATGGGEDMGAVQARVRPRRAGRGGRRRWGTAAAASALPRVMGTRAVCLCGCCPALAHAVYRRATATRFADAPRVSHTQQDGRAPLHLAAYQGHLEVVKAMIQNNANVTATTGVRAALPVCRSLWCHLTADGLSLRRAGGLDGPARGGRQGPPGGRQSPPRQRGGRQRQGQGAF